MTATIICDPDTFERFRGALAWVGLEMPANYECQQEISPRWRSPKDPKYDKLESPVRDHIRYGGAVNIWRAKSGMQPRHRTNALPRRPFRPTPDGPV